MYAGDRDQKSHLETLKTATNRLAGLGVSNMHAAMRGVPRTEESDARRIAATIVAMRALGTRRSKMAYKECTLQGAKHH